MGYCILQKSIFRKFKQMTQPILTIMIPTTPDRERSFWKLMFELEYQIENNGFKGMVEIVYLCDNKEISVGRKRQLLLEMAKGDFVVGIDSDDFVHPDYIGDIVSTLIKNKDNIDHVGFEEDCLINGERSKSIFSIRHQQWDENKDGYDHIRCANPKSVIRREKALLVGYEDMRFGEDRVFSEAVTPLLVGEVYIDKPLYKYIHVSTDHNERYGIQ